MHSWHKGNGCYMSKTDVQSAFRIMPIHRSDYHLLGFSWEGEYYYDKAVLFGASSSCRLFEATSKALEWIAITKLGCMAVVHILDDFLFLNSSPCVKTLASLSLSTRQSLHAHLSLSWVFV